MVIDTRTSAWVEKAIIPETLNIPWDTLDIGKSDPVVVQDLLGNQLGAMGSDDGWNYDNAKTLVMFCNGTGYGLSMILVVLVVIVGIDAIVRK